MPTTKQPEPPQKGAAPQKTEDGLERVRTAYSKLVNHIKRQQGTMEQLNGRIDEQQETIGKLQERLDELTTLLEIVQQRQYEMEQQKEVREQNDKQATMTQPEQQSPPQTPQQEQTHHTTALSEGQIKRAYALAHSSGIQPADMKKWVKQTYGKELKDLTRNDYNQLCATLEQAKGKGVLPTLQPGREYSQAS